MAEGAMSTGRRVRADDTSGAECVSLQQGHALEDEDCFGSTMIFLLLILILVFLRRRRTKLKLEIEL
jgi:hypothetical protein